jgi:hypothetical protein
MGIVARVAAQGLPDPVPSRLGCFDDTSFGTLLDAITSERVTGHFAACLHAGVVEATDAQRTLAYERHEQALAGDLVLERLLADTSVQLASHGIPHRALKGPVAARTAYPDPSLRSFGDVDLLVAGPRFDDAISLLEHAGARARFREPRPRFTARFGKGVCLVTPNGLELDVHRSFVAGPFGLAIDATDLFAHAETITLGAVAVPVPPAPVRFLHACYHAALTSPRITAMRDVAQLATDHLDLDAVLELAARWRGRAVLQRALARTRASLPAHLDGPVYRWAGRYRPDRFETRSLESYLSADNTYARQMVTGVWALRGVRARAAYGAALLLPDRSYVAEREGSYLRRWTRAFSLARSSKDAC